MKKTVTCTRCGHEWSRKSEGKRWSVSHAVNGATRYRCIARSACLLRERRLLASFADDPHPKRVWVAFREGLPEGVTRLQSEADEWRDDGCDVVSYVLK